MRRPPKTAETKIPRKNEIMVLIMQNYNNSNLRNPPYYYSLKKLIDHSF